MEAAWHTVPGGTARVAIDLAAALDRRDDVEVEGLAARHSAPPHADWVPPIATTHHLLPRPLLYESWSRWSWPQPKGVRACDIVHSTTIVAPPRSGAPLVVSVHDLAFRRHPDRFPSRARRLYERSWKRVLERADAVICPSAATSADLRAGGIDVDRLRLVPLGHDPLPVSAEDRAAVRERFGLTGRFILATGTVEPRKNLPILIEAFELLDSSNDVQLVLAGPAGWGETPEQLLAPLSPGRRERVVVTGHVPTAALAALYSEASVFCYPSLLEGFGLPVLEAMSYGAPVVTSRGTATEEVAGDAAVMIDPTSAGDVARALDRVLADPDFAAELTAKGLARSGTYTWDEVAVAMVDIYDSLL